MKWTLSLFLLLAAVSFLGLWYLEDPGYIEIIWLGFEVQLSLVVGIFILLCFFFMSLCLFWFLGIPFRWVSFFQQARSRKATHDLLDLYTTFEAENFTGALQHQKKGQKRLKNDPLFLWISGNAFKKADKPLDAEKCFMALSQNPSAPFLGLKGQIRMALQGGDSKLASALLEQAEKLVPTSPWVLKHLLALAYEKNDFKNAEKLTLRLEDLGYFSSEISKKQTAFRLYLQAMQSDTSPSQKEDLLRKSHHLSPSLPEAAASFAKLLGDQGNKREALHVLETTWGIAPTQSLGDLYLKIFSPKNELEAYQVTNQLIKTNPTSVESLLLVARIALKANLWGEARASLMSLLKQHPTLETYHLLATLELAENQNLKAALAWLDQGFYMANALKD